MKQEIRIFNEANEFVNEGPWPVNGKLGGVSQEAKLLEKAFKAAGVKVFKVKEYGSRGANYFVDVQTKGGKTTISIEVNQVSNVVFMHSQGRDLKLGELKENPRELIKVLKVLKNQPGFGQSKLAKKESVNEAGGVVTARIQQKPKGYWAVFNKRGQSQFEGDKKFMTNKNKKASTLSPNAIGSILDRARPGDKHLEFKAQFSRYYFNESVNEAIKPQGYSQLNTMVKHATIYLRDLSKALRKQDDDAVLREVHFLAAQFTTMEKMLKDKKWNAKYNESVSEGFGGELKGKDKEKFEKARKENAEQLGYKLTGKGDIREAIKFSKEEMTQLHQNGKLEKDGYTYVYKEK
jgi:Pyruvate/2-oxoacid:ferredoxin oxidoreductase gamma subunit